MSEKVLVSPAELSDLLKTGSIVVIDTRDPATYAAGHLPNAVNIHDIFTYLAMSTPEGVAANKVSLATSACSAVSGRRAMRSAISSSMTERSARSAWRTATASPAPTST